MVVRWVRDIPIVEPPIKDKVTIQKPPYNNKVQVVYPKQ